MASVSIIIVSYKVMHYIEQCIDSVRRSVPDAQIIVVDNNSGDGSVEYIESRCPGVRVIANTDNLGFGKANNLALELVETPYVLFLNPDTVVGEDTIPACIAHMESHPETGAIGVSMQYGNGRFALESRRSIPTPYVSFCHMTGLGRLFPRSRKLARYHLTYLDNSAECPIEVVSGAYMFARTDLVKRLGGFDPDFFMYGEDIDLSYRILKAGYSNRYLPVPIVHYKGESTVKTTYHYAKVFYDAMLIFYGKHFHDRNRLFPFVVRMTVKAKQISTFIGQNIRAGRNRLVPEREACLFVGSRENFEKASDLVVKSRFLRDMVLASDSNLNELAVDGDRRAVVFDVQSFSYREIMDWMRSMALSGRFLTMCLYNAATGCIISEDEVVL